ncbi:MAG: hypothetical protein AB3K77_17195 [Methanosarcinaceae archaeon]
MEQVIKKVTNETIIEKVTNETIIEKDLEIKTFKDSLKIFKTL